jgi:predicted dehydrogenase
MCGDSNILMQRQILVIGCGSIGQRHLRCFSKTGRAQVAAWDTNPALLEKVRNEYKVVPIGDLQVGGRFDGVVICTPAHTHIPVARSVLKSGSAMLIEKPLSVEPQEIGEFKIEVGAANALVGVGYVYHFMPAVQEVRRVLQSDAFGRPLHASVVAGQDFGRLRPAYRETYYARHETGGGAIQDALTHLFNLVEWLIGPTTKVYCEAAHQVLQGVSVEDTVCVTAKNGGALVGYVLNQFQGPNEITIQIHCERGSVKVETHEQRWAVFSPGSKTWDYRSAPVNHLDDIFLAQANAFLDGLEGKPNLLCTLDEAIHTLKCNTAALQSARTGVAVTIQ